MDMSDYDEGEILLMEGLTFIVQSVEDDQDRMGNKIVLITLGYVDLYEDSYIGGYLSGLSFLFG